MGETLRLRGKTAIVTGGASGFGAGIARKFVGEGARVMMTGNLLDARATLSTAAPSEVTFILTGKVNSR